MEVVISIIYVILLGILGLIIVDVYDIRLHYKAIQQDMKHHGKRNEHDVNELIRLIGEIGCLILCLMIFVIITLIMIIFKKKKKMGKQLSDVMIITMVISIFAMVVPIIVMVGTLLLFVLSSYT